MNDDLDLMGLAQWGNQSSGQTYRPFNLGNAVLQQTAAPQIMANSPMDWLNQVRNAPIGTQTPAQAGGGWFTKDAILGKDGQQGWGNLALGALQGIGGAYMGMKQYGLAKDALAQSQNQFNLNYNAQRQTTNTQLEDRQRARVAATGGTAESVDSYMARNRIE